jgi:hypothetical protein
MKGKVICIDISEDEKYFKPGNLTDNRVLGLTLNKTYDITWVDNRWYEIVNDDGFKTFYDKKRFINLAEWRDRQIDSILKDD